MLDWQQVCVVSWQAGGEEGKQKETQGERDRANRKNTNRQRKVNRDSQPADPNHHRMGLNSRSLGTRRQIREAFGEKLSAEVR